METVEQQINQTILSNSIMLAIELDSSFKLYSFRIIDHSQYTERVKELVENFIYSTKNQD